MLAWNVNIRRLWRSITINIHKKEYKRKNKIEELNILFKEQIKIIRNLSIVLRYFNSSPLFYKRTKGTRVHIQGHLCVEKKGDLSV